MAASYLLTLRNRVRPAGASTSAARAFGLLLAAGCLALAPSAWPAKPARTASAGKPAPAAGKDACQIGRSQHAGGDVLKAIASLERCVDKEPRNREGWATLAAARLEAGRFSEAADAYGRAHSLRPGDAPFLVSYLDALEGSGRAVERVAVLRALSEHKRDDGRHAERLLALIDSLGPDKHPEDRLYALEKLSLGPDAEIRHQEMLAAAYLGRGMREKAQAEYRGLLSRKPEVGEYWGGLAASIAKEDPAAALECYKKAIFFSNQAQNRAAYEKEVAALKAGQDKVAAAKSGEDKLAAAKAAEDKAARERSAREEKEKQEKLAKAKAAEEKAALEKAAREEKDRQEKLAKAKAAEDKAAQEKLAQEKAAREKAAKEEKEKQDKLAQAKAAEEKAAREKAAKEEKEKQDKLAQEKAAQDKAAKEKSAAAQPAKPFDIKAFQDSIFKAELEKRLAVLKKPETAAAKPGAVTPPSASPGLGKEEQEKKAKAEREEKEKQEKLAREEKEKQEKLAKEEKEKQEKLAKEAAKKAEEDRKLQEKLAKEEKEKQEKLAKEAAKKAEEERKLQEKLAKQEKEKQEKLAKEEREKQERLAKEAAKKAEEDRKQKEKLAKDSLAKVESERLAKEKAAKEIRDRFVKDSLARAEQERVAKAEADKKAKAEEEKARKQKEERDRFVKDSVAKVEKERLAKLEAEKKAREERDRFVKDSVAKVEKERLAKLEAEKKAREARDRFVKDSVAKVEQERLARLEAERKAREARDRFVKDSLAKVEKERLAKLEIERKAREAREKFVKDSLFAKAEADRKAREAREKFVRDSLFAKAEADRKAREAREKFVRDSLHKVEQERLARLEAERKAKEARDRFVRDSLAKVEKERLARLEAERKAREEQERKERLAREKQERHDRAISLYRSGQLDSADAWFRIVLGETPSPDAYYYAGRTHLDKGRFDKALELLLKAPKDKPDMDGLLGRAYLKTGKKKEALEALERHFAKTSDPNVLEDICALRKPAPDQGPWAACMEKLAEKRPMVGKYQEELAVHYRKAGDKARSLERYSRLLLLEPAHGEANYQLGMDWGSQGVHDRAVPCLEKAVAAFPGRSEAWKLLAKGQAATGRRPEAWKSYAKAASLLPKDIDVARGRLSLAKDPGREADLPAAYLAVLKLAPADGDANMGYARLRFQAKDYPAAEKHFRAGIGESREAAAWGQYGRSLLETRKLDEAAAALQKALDLGETSIALKLDLARLHLDKGDADKAEALVKQISAKIPSDPEPYFWLSRIAEKRQQAAVQEEFLRKAHQLKPDEVRYAEALAKLFKERDEFKQAVGVLSPNSARLSSEGRMLLADCLAATGEGQKALDIYTELFRKEPGPGVLARRIDALVRMGRAGEAVESARATAFADRPEVQYSIAKAHLSLSESHVLKGDLDLAISLMKKALDSDGHRPEFHYYLGRAYHMRGKLGKAHDAYTDALRYRVEYPDAVYWKGVAMVDDGKPLEARNYFEELSQHADLRWKARGLKGMARVFEAEGKWEAVEHHLQRSIATMPTADAMAYLSRVYLKLGRFPEAEDWARKALALDANHEEGTLALAEALAARKKIPEALGLASAALRVKPLSCDLLVQSARLNLEAGRLDSTLTTTGKAIEVCPTEPLPHFYAGMAMRGSNKPEDAKRHFKSFRKLGGDKKMLPE